MIYNEPYNETIRLSKWNETLAALKLLWADKYDTQDLHLKHLLIDGNYIESFELDEIFVSLDTVLRYIHNLEKDRHEQKPNQSNNGD